MKKKIINGYEIHKLKGYNIKYHVFFKKIVELDNIKIENYISKNFYKKYNKNLFITIKQFFCSHLYNKNFNIKYFLSLSEKKKIIYPVPKLISKLFKVGDIKFNYLFSSFLFFFLCLKNIFKSVLKVFLILFEKNLNAIPGKKSIFFVDLKIYFFPFNKKKDLSCIGWFLKNEINKNNTKYIFHTERRYYDRKIYSNKKFIFKKSLIPSIHKFNSKLNFLCFSMYEILFSLFNLLRGKWIDSLLIDQIVDIIKLKNINYNSLPTKYFFSSSFGLVRPMWTYYLNKAKFIYFNYAASMPGFFYNKEYDYDFYNRLMFWDEELHWSKKYIDYLSSIRKNIKNVRQVGYIYGQDTNEKNNLKLNSKKKKVAVFDITPPQEILSITNNITNLNYHTSDNIIKFLNDIYNCAKAFDYQILWKQRWDTNIYKYHINKKIHDSKYIDFSSNFSAYKDVFKFNSYTSPVEIIKKSDLIISLPFTSTALIANYFKKKTVYYDPSSILSRSDRGAQGIRLILGVNELKKYFKNLK